MIDLGQATLVPGLIDCHAHLLISGDLGRLDPGELLTTTVTQTSPSFRALLGARNAKEDLDAGITSARIVGHSGIDGDVALRDAINAGWISGPRLQASGRKITAIGGQATILQDEGMSGIDIIRSSTMNAAELMGWADRVRELAAGKFADIIAVGGDPVQDIGLLQHVQFVMKGATVVRNDFARR